MVDLAKMQDPKTGELPNDLERAAAALWRKENPRMSVFACDRKMKDRYRRRVLESADKADA